MELVQAPHNLKSKELVDLKHEKNMASMQEDEIGSEQDFSSEEEDREYTGNMFIGKEKV